MAASKIQHCAEKGRLLTTYNRGVIEWAKAVRQLSNIPSNDDFAILLHKVDEARSGTKRARTAYAAHVAEHGC